MIPLLSNDNTSMIRPHSSCRCIGVLLLPEANETGENVKALVDWNNLFKPLKSNVILRVGL